MAPSQGDEKEGISVTIQQVPAQWVETALKPCYHLGPQGKPTNHVSTQGVICKKHTTLTAAPGPNRCATRLGSLQHVNTLFHRTPLLGHINNIQLRVLYSFMYWLYGVYPNFFHDCLSTAQPTQLIDVFVATCSTYWNNTAAPILRMLCSKRLSKEQGN